MPMCKNCNEVVAAGQLNENGFCEKCLSTDEGQKEEKKHIKQSENTNNKKGSGMKVFFYILSVLAFLLGGSFLLEANSAIHQILAFIVFLIGAVFLSSGGIISAMISKDN